MSNSEQADVRVVARGGVIRFLGFAFNRFISLVFVGIVVRFLGPAGFGLYRQIASILEMLGNFGSFGFNLSALRSITNARATENHGRVRGSVRVAVTSTVLISSGLFLIVWVAARPIAAAFTEKPSHLEEMAYLLRLGSAFIPLYAVTLVLQACTKAYLTVTPSVIVGNVVQPVSLFIVSVAALMLGFGVTGAVSGLTTSAFITTVSAIWFYRRILTPVEKSAKPTFSIGPMVRFAIPQAGASIFRVGSSGPGIVLLGLFGTDRDVGLFAIAVSLQTLATVFPTSILAIWSAMVADLYQRGEVERLGSLYKLINRWIASFSFLIIAALIVQPESFVRVLGGRQAEDAALLTSILAVGTLFQVGTGPCAELITMAGWPAINLIISAVGLGLFVVFSWLFVPDYGGIGMAIVSASILALTNLTQVLQAKLLTGIQPFGRSFLKPVTATIAATLILLLWRVLPVDHTEIVDLAGLAAATAVHVLVLKILGVDPEELFVWERIKFRFFRVLRGEANTNQRRTRPGRELDP